MLRSRIYDNSEYLHASSLYPKWARQVEKPYFSVWVGNLFFLPTRKISPFSGQKGYEYFIASIPLTQIYVNELSENGEVLSTNPLTGAGINTAVGSYTSAIQGAYTDIRGYANAKSVLFDFSAAAFPTYFSLTIVLTDGTNTVSYSSEYFKSSNCSEGFVLIGAKNYQAIVLNQEAGGVISYANNIPNVDILDRGVFTGSPIITGSSLASGDLRFQYSFLAVEGFLTEGELKFTKKFHSDLLNITQSAEVQQTVDFIQTKRVPEWVRNEIAAICASSVVIAIENVPVGGFEELPYQLFGADFDAQKVTNNLASYSLNLQFLLPKINQYPHG